MYNILNHKFDIRNYKNLFAMLLIKFESITCFSKCTKATNVLV